MESYFKMCAFSDGFTTLLVCFELIDRAFLPISKKKPAVRMIRKMSTKIKP